MKKLMVVSHERSGTHFLINTLANLCNISANQEDLYITESEENYESISYKIEVQTHLKSIALNQRTIIKSHHHHDFFEDFEFEKHELKPFYIYRDPLDTIVSCYHYFNAHPQLQHKNIFPKAISPKDLLLNIIPTEYLFDSAYSFHKFDNMLDRWIGHTKPYLEDDRFIKVKYSELNLNFDLESNRIALLCLENPITANKPSLLNDRSVSPRKGTVGDWKNYFHYSEHEQILEQVKQKGIIV